MDIETLHELEKKVLKALAKGEAKIEELIKETGLKEDQIRRALSWLNFKNLIKTSEKHLKQIRLTTLGKNYLEKGLPEQVLIKLAELGKDVKHALEKLSREEFNAALGVLKEYVDIKKGKLVLKKKAKVENILKNIEKLSQPKTQDLIKRRLVEEVKKIDKKYSLTTLGTNVSKKVRLGAPRKFDLGSKKEIIIGKRQPYYAFMDEVKDKIMALGFKEMTGPLVESNFWNMDALFIPQYHPARDLQDAYYIKEPKYSKPIKKKFLNAVKRAHEKGIAGSRGWGYKFDTKETHRLILRSHDTPISQRLLANNPKIPGKYFQISKCFRYDVIDATHLPDFYQMGGIVLSEDNNLRNLLGLLKVFAEEIAGIKKTKFVASYFPYVEPGIEILGKHPKHGWIELAGAGIFRPEVTAPFGIKIPVIAWGFGFDRLAMFKLGEKDIRELLTHKLNKLRKMRSL